MFSVKLTAHVKHVLDLTFPCYYYWVQRNLNFSVSNVTNYSTNFDISTKGNVYMYFSDNILNLLGVHLTELLLFFETLVLFHIPQAICNKLYSHFVGLKLNKP